MKPAAIFLALSIAMAGQMAEAAKGEPAKPPAARGTLSVEVSNLRSGGSVLVALFDGPRAFPSFKGQTAAKRVAVSGPKAQVVFDDVPYGRYALAVVHDTNDNGRLDTKLGVIPAEPIGFSNGARVGRFGPPSYEAAAFEFRSKRQAVRVAVE